MNTLAVLVASAGAFVLLHYRLIPRLEFEIRLDRSLGIVKKAALLPILHLCRTIVLCAFVASSLIAILSVILRLMGAFTVGNLEAAVLRAQGLRDLVSAISRGSALITAGILILGLLFLSYRTAKKRILSTFSALYEGEVKRLLAEREAKAWPEIAPSPEMEQLQKVRTEIDAKLDAAVLAEAVNPAVLQTLRKHRALVEDRLLWLDVHRRLTLRLDPDLVTSPVPRNLWERVQVFFYSQGLINLVRGGSQLLSATCILLIFMGLAGAQTGPLKSAADARVSALEFRLTEEDARKSFDTAKSQAETTGPAPSINLDPELSDAQVLDILSSRFEASASGAIARSFGIALRQGPSARSLRVRDAILRTMTQAAPDRFAPGPSLVNDGTLTALERQTISAPHVASEGPTTELGKLFRARAETLARESPQAWGRIRETVRKAAGSFQQPASVNEIQAVLVNRTVGSLASGTFDSSTEMGRSLTALADSLNARAVRASTEVLEREYLAAVLHTMDTNAAGERLAWLAEHRRIWTAHSKPQLGAFLRDLPTGEGLARHLPALSTPAGTASDLENAQKVLNRIQAAATGGKPGVVRSSLAESLSTYEDWFPGRLASETATPRGKLVAAWMKTAGVSRTMEEAGANFARARNFKALLGFRRVGGIIIGRTGVPSQGPGSDLTALDWHRAGRTIELTLIGRNGQSFPLGSFRVELVNQALAYAADGRLTTVTVVNTEPLLDQKILLHPALLDTPLGCRAIEMDTYIFDFLKGNREVQTATSRVAYQHALYSIAWADRVLKFLPMIQANSDDLRKFLEATGALAREVRTDSSIRDLARAGLLDRKCATDSTCSPISAKTEWYDQSLVRNIAACMPDNADMGLFESCLERRAEKPENQELLSNRWLMPPPDYGIHSTVREREYTLDAEVQFLKGARADESSPALWPFDYEIQVTFSTPPGFREDAQGGDEDTDPWSFSTVQPLVATSVSNQRMRNPRVREVIDAMQQFTILQRLFRAALQENLGPDFPIERLESLATETADAAAGMTRTHRWRSRPGQLEREFLLLLDVTLADPVFSLASLDGTRADMTRCRTLVRAVKRPEKLGVEAWGASCDLSGLEQRLTPLLAADPNDEGIVRAAGKASLVARTSSKIAELRELRSHLLTSLDDIDPEAKAVCPSL